MQYLGIISMLLFVFMILTDRKHLGRLNQSVKDFEKINSGAEITLSYLNLETTQMPEYSEAEPVNDEKMFITSSFNGDGDFSRPSVVIAVTSPDFLW